MCLVFRVLSLQDVFLWNMSRLRYFSLQQYFIILCFRIVERLKFNPEELGPLSYIAGYVLQALYKRSKNSVHWNSTHSIELQTLLKSMKEDAKDDKYIESLSRGALWTPNEYVKCIAENAEYLFCQHQSHSKEAVTTAIPTEKIVDEILALPVVISVWESITTDLDCDISNECKRLALESFVRLFV